MAGLFCDDATKTCAVPLECRGPDVFFIGVVEREWRCPVNVRAQSAASAAAAEQCVAAKLAENLATVAAGSVIAQYTYCLTSKDLASHSTVEVEAYSEEDARACANKQCVGCTVAEEPGPCP